MAKKRTMQSGETLAQRRIAEATSILRELGFGPRQCNSRGAQVLLAMIALKPDQPWHDASEPLMGTTPSMKFIADSYPRQYQPNSRESVRDDAIKYFVEFGLLIRNPDNPNRPTNSGKTVYQIEPAALALLRSFGSDQWQPRLADYLSKQVNLKRELDRHRQLALIPVLLPDGTKVCLSPGGQNPLIKQIVEEFGPRFVPGGIVIYLGDTADKFQHMDSDYMAELGITIDSAAKIPDVVIHDTQRNWLVLVEAVTTAGPVDGKRRKELKELFTNHSAGLVFVTAFETRRAMQSFCTLISWESEVWIAEHPDHMIHFNGERFLGPYADAMPQR